jgi:hypothetical protein
MDKIGSGIRDGKKSDPGSGINIPDPQLCLQAVSTIIKNATWWMHEVVPKLYKPEPQVEGEHLD